jgi:hypothetical protein
VKENAMISGENVDAVRPSASEAQDGAGCELASAATAGQSPKVKRGAWLSQSADLSNMSRWRVFMPLVLVTAVA